MSNMSHLTAIVRKKPSLPMQFLNANHRLNGRVLDYGCGRGFDADFFKTEKYDPYYFPEKPKGKFDTITCNYVLNTIQNPFERLDVIIDIMKMLSDGGSCYITVRRDPKIRNGFTKSGSWQGFVTLPYKVIKEKKNQYIMYEVKKQEK